MEALPRSQDETSVRGPRGKPERPGAIIANGVPLHQDRSIVALDQHKGAEVHVEHITERMSTVPLERISGTLKKYHEPGGERHGVYAAGDLGEFVHGPGSVEKNDEERSHDDTPVVIVFPYQVRESYGHGHDSLS